MINVLNGQRQKQDLVGSEEKGVGHFGIKISERKKDWFCFLHLYLHMLSARINIHMIHRDLFLLHDYLPKSCCPIYYCFFLLLWNHNEVNSSKQNVFHYPLLFVCLWHQLGEKGALKGHTCCMFLRITWTTKVATLFELWSGPKETILLYRGAATAKICDLNISIKFCCWFV